VLELAQRKIADLAEKATDAAGLVAVVDVKHPRIGTLRSSTTDSATVALVGEHRLVLRLSQIKLTLDPPPTETVLAIAEMLSVLLGADFATPTAGGADPACGCTQLVVFTPLAAPLTRSALIVDAVTWGSRHGFLPECGQPYTGRCRAALTTRISRG
jgi:hypothetical protein